MNKIERVEKYIYEFFSSRFDFYDTFYRSVHRDRRYGIYKLKNGTSLMDFIISIHSNIEELFYSEKLIPQNFATPDSLFEALNRFKDYLNENQKLIDPNLKGENTNYIISDLQKIKNELVQMIDYAVQIYDFEDTVIPYQDLRFYLIKNEIPKFIETLKSLFASLSYTITKTKEGYFHSNVHIILRLLGFEIKSEEETNVGRIDAVIRFVNTIYILEFKFQEKGNSSEKALEQIKEKKYYQKFLLEKKKIIAIGIGFSNELKNISDYNYEVIKE